MDTVNFYRGEDSSQKFYAGTVPVGSNIKCSLPTALVSVKQAYVFCGNLPLD